MLLSDKQVYYVCTVFLMFVFIVNKRSQYAISVLFVVFNAAGPAQEKTEIDVTLCGKVVLKVSEPLSGWPDTAGPPLLDVSRVAQRKPRPPLP